MSTAITFTDEELAAMTLAHLDKEARQMWVQPCPLLDDAEKNKKKVSGGKRLIVSFEVREHSQTTQLTTGWEPINLGAQPTLVPGTDLWAYFVRPVLLNRRERLEASGKAEIINLWKQRVENTTNGLRRQIQKQLLKGNISALSDLNTINGFVDSTGFLEQDAVGSQANTLHGVSRATYATLQGFQNQIYNGADSFSTNGLAGLDSIIASIRNLGNGTINGKTDLPKSLKLYMSVNGTAFMKRALRTYERYVKKEDFDGGKLYEIYSGVPIRETSDMPTTASDEANGDPWTAAFIDWDSLELLVNGDEWFNWGDVISLPGYEVQSQNCRTMAQMRCKYLGTSGVLHSAETY